MPNCSVSTCSNHHRKTKGSKIVYYGFPRNPDLTEAWIKFCSRKDDFKIEFARICSVHFRQDAFQRNLKAELLGIEEKLKLKPDAIPTENKPDRYRTKNFKKELKLASNQLNITEVWVREEKSNQTIFLKEESICGPFSEEEDVDRPAEVIKNPLEEEIDEKLIKKEEEDEKTEVLYSLKVEPDL